ncbi:hypothetical protein ACVWWO_003714 [Bradyrhizobium sp. F1.13.1]
MGVERMYPPKHWRMRAEEFRTKADNCQFLETKATLRLVANNYDELAQRAEQIVTLAELDQRTSQARGGAQQYLHDQRAIMHQQRQQAD